MLLKVEKKNKPATFPADSVLALEFLRPAEVPGFTNALFSHGPDAWGPPIIKFFDLWLKL